MADKKSRVNTNALFTSIIGKPEEAEQQEVKPEVAAPLEAPTTEKEPVQNSKVGRKTGEVKKQVSIYLPPDLDKELSIQGAMKEKETDKSSIARTGIEIALAISPQTYLELKEKSETTGKGIGDIVQEVLERGF